MTLPAVNITAGVNAQTHVIIRADSNNPIHQGRVRRRLSAIKEAPAYWAGALSLGEETPKEGETTDRTF